MDAGCLDCSVSEAIACLDPTSKSHPSPKEGGRRRIIWILDDIREFQFKYKILKFLTFSVIEIPYEQEVTSQQASPFKSLLLFAVDNFERGWLRTSHLSLIT
jgi:hypothetical protein